MSHFSTRCAYRFAALLAAIALAAPIAGCGESEEPESTEATSSGAYPNLAPLMGGESSPEEERDQAESEAEEAEAEAEAAQAESEEAEQERESAEEEAERQRGYAEEEAAQAEQQAEEAEQERDEIESESEYGY